MDCRNLSHVATGQKEVSAVGASEGNCSKRKIRITTGEFKIFTDESKQETP